MKKKLISSLLCIVAIASLTGCKVSFHTNLPTKEQEKEVATEVTKEVKVEDKEVAKEVKVEDKEEAKEVTKEVTKEVEESTEVVEASTEAVEETTETASDKKASKKISNAEVSDDWTDMTFAVDGVTYTIPFSYADIKDSWNFDLADYGYENGYILNSMDYIYSSIALEHASYDANFFIGLKNYTDDPIEIIDGNVWAAQLEMTYADQYPEILLPGGITWGSTHEEVKAAYGEPEDTYRSDDLKYTSYDYNSGDKNFSVIVYDDKGLTEFDFKDYE